jgi:hypothetical protein
LHKTKTPWLTIAVFAVLSFAANPVLYAQEDYYEFDSGETNKTKIPGALEVDDDKVFYTLGYGAAASWLVRKRTVTQFVKTGTDEEGQPVGRTEENDLSYIDFFPGLYLNLEVYNIKNPIKDLSLDIVPLVRLAAYYPLNFFSDTSTINREPQRSETPSHFGTDMLVGLKFELLDSDYVRFYITPALHLLYLGSDKWNYFNLGGAAMIGAEVSLNEKWTFLINGGISVDSGNLGNNRDEESFDSCAQYHVDLGFRYSVKKRNNFSLFGPKKPKVDTAVEYDEYE